MCLQTSTQTSQMSTRLSRCTNTNWTSKQQIVVLFPVVCVCEESQTPGPRHAGDIYAQRRLLSHVAFIADLVILQRNRLGNRCNNLIKTLVNRDNTKVGSAAEQVTIMQVNKKNQLMKKTREAAKCGVLPSPPSSFEDDDIIETIVEPVQIRCPKGITRKNKALKEQVKQSVRDGSTIQFKKYLDLTAINDNFSVSSRDTFES